MKVALIEYKVRIIPPSGDTPNGVMDAALARLRTGKHALHDCLMDHLSFYGLVHAGFTVEVEEIIE